MLTVMVALTALYWLEQKDLGASSQDCEEAVSSAEMRECANERYEAADAKLNQVYQRLASQLPAQRREQLKVAQQAWIRFREKNAAFVAGAAEGGTLFFILEVSELADITEQRIEQLKAYLE